MLNLAELDRLEREATAYPWVKYPDPVLPARDEWEIFYEGASNWTAHTLSEADAALITAARNQLRPLLELVDRMGEALEAHPLGFENHHPHSKEPYNHECAICRFWRLGRDALAEYRRAKGGSP